MPYVVSSDLQRVDRDWVWRMLSTEAYWHRWRTRAQVEPQMDGAWRVVGVFDSASGSQVAYARAVSDGICEAYLADVIVDPAHRARGLGKLLMKAMVDDGPGAEFRWTLFTDDAHGLYAQFGFAAPDHTAMVRPSRVPRGAEHETAWTFGGHRISYGLKRLAGLGRSHRVLRYSGT